MNDDAFTIRTARADDLAAIVAMLADDHIGATRETVADPVADCYRRAFAVIDADPRNELVVAEDAAGAVVGCLQLTVIPRLSRSGMGRAQIEGVRVASAQRGAGLGRVLFEWAIARARDAGCGLVQLTSDKTRPDAIRFYEGLGFRATHEGMKLDLGAA